MLELYFLGAPRLELDRKPAVLDRSKALALLAYLAVEGGSQSREWLATFLWPDYDRQRAYAYLRRTLWAINDTLGSGWLQVDRDQVELRRLPGLRVDVWEFRAALSECSNHGHAADQACPQCIQPLERAVSLYQGDFLSGLGLRDSTSFDEWQFFQSDRLKSELAGALEHLAQAYRLQGNNQAAIGAARRWLALDLLNESAHRQLILLYAQAGQRSAAMRQYQDCQRILQQELGVAPEPETTRLYESLKAGGQPDGTPVDQRTTAAGQTLRSPHQQPVSGFQPAGLPTAALPLVGRQTELADLERLLAQPECRLLTLLGPGGFGKTRLSLQVAAQAAAQPFGLDENPYPDGVVFVPLAPVNSPENLASSIASAIGLQFRSEQLRRDTPETQQVQLIEYLRPRQMLLVLDNFEHMIQRADLLSAILSGCPAVRLLVTSRERLRLEQEWVFEVLGMSYPADGSQEPLESFGAVQLFIQHARRVSANFIATDEDLRGIARICQLVGGSPLAIELAAAWIKMLSPSEIAGEIERNLDFLTTSLRDVPERHHSLRAVFEHSWSLLAEQEQIALMRLSVFRTPFRREAAAAVVLGEQFSGASFLLRLSALLDKSLLRRVSAVEQEVRFEMHELIKQYTAEKLRTADGQVHNRYLHYYAAWMGRLVEEMRSQRQIQALSLIEAEIEDVRAAWRLAIEQGNLSAMQQLLHGLYLFYNIRNRQEEAEEDFRLALESLLPRSLALEQLTTASLEIQTLAGYLLAYYSSALFTSGNFDLANRYSELALELAGYLDEADQARVNTLLYFGNARLPAEQVEQRYRQAYQYFEQAGSRWDVAMAMLVHVSFAQYNIVDMQLARRLCQQSLALFRELGDRFGMVLALNSQAALSYELGDYEEVIQAGLEGRELAQQLGDRWRVATALLILGQARVAQGEYAKAEAVYLESLVLVRELGNRRVVARYLACLGYVYYLENKLTAAQDLFLEGLELSRQIDDRREMAMSSMNLGNIAQSNSNLAEARRRYLFAINILKEIPFARWEFSICLKRMGSLCVLSGERSSAWDYYRRALVISQQLKRVPEMLDNLVGMAELLIQEGRYEPAVELLTLALAHTETAQDVQARSEVLLADLETRLMPLEFSRANTRGQGLSPDEAADSWISAVDQP